MCWVGGGVGLGVCYPELAESSRQVSLVYFNANYQVPVARRRTVPWRDETSQADGFEAVQRLAALGRVGSL